MGTLTTRQRVSCSLQLAQWLPCLRLTPRLQASSTPGHPSPGSARAAWGWTATARCECQLAMRVQLPGAPLRPATPSVQGGHDTLTRSSVNGELTADSKLDADQLAGEGYDDDGHVMRTGESVSGSEGWQTACSP